MKRAVILYLFFVLGAFSASAQNKNADIARSEFRKGNYKDAVGLYNGAIAVTADAGHKESLVWEKEKSGRCWKCLDEAEWNYSRLNYRTALRLYLSVVSMNPLDAYAKKRIEICRSRIAEEEYLAKENARINSLLERLLKVNDISQLRKFSKEYPRYSRTGDLNGILAYYDNPKSVEDKTVPDRQSLLVRYGDFYLESNREVAAFFYEKAASCGSLTGFYNLARVLPANAVARSKRLSAFAAANGNKEAARFLKLKYPGTRYDRESARILYRHLGEANQGNLFSKIYCQKHKEILGLRNLALIDDGTNYVSDDSGVLYELALMYSEGKFIKKDLNKGNAYLRKAASMGNQKAQYRLAAVQEQYGHKNALLLCAAINGNESARMLCTRGGLEYAKEYVKFLKQEKCDWFSVRLFMLYYAKNYQIEDLDATLVSLSCYKYLNRKDARKVIKLLKSRKVWDIETVWKIRSVIGAYGSKQNKYHKKIMKYLRKVPTARGVRKEGDFQVLVINGYCDNPHETKEITIVDYLKSDS